MAEKKVLVCANTIWNLSNFRLNLIKTLTKEGYNVILAAPILTQKDREIQAHFTTLGYTVYNLCLSRGGKNPFSDAFFLIQLLLLIYKNKIDFILPFTVKPNLYSCIVSYWIQKLTKRQPKVLCNITGLGSAFLDKGYLGYILHKLYKFALKCADTIFFQNTDDRDLLLKYNLLPQNLINADKIHILPGSGVDLEYFSPQNPQNRENSNTIIFLCIARLLWDKGIGEFHQAAKSFKKENPQAPVQFCLLGSFDSSNPNAISKDTIKEWENEGVIEYLGSSDDVRPFILKSSCVVLASYYREGTPRSLLEAMAMGKPIIASNSVGTKETIKTLNHQTNGFYCKPRDIESLKECFKKFCSLTTEQRIAMQSTSRNVATIFFDEKIVLQSYTRALKILESL